MNAGGELVLGNSLALQNSTLDGSSTSGGSSPVLDFSTLTSVTLGGLVTDTFPANPFVQLVLTNDISGAVDLRVGNNNTSTSYAGQISGSGSLTKIGSGTPTLSGTSSYTGATNLYDGILAFSVLSNLGSGTAINFNGGELQYATGNVADISSRTVTINVGGGTIDTNGNNVTFAHPIGGMGGLFKVGPGTLTLLGTDTYTGGTTIYGGTVRLGDGAANNGSVTGNILDDSQLTVANPYDLIYGGIISGSGSVTKVGAGALLLSGANSYSGATTVLAGTLRLNIASGAPTIAAGATVTVASGATLELAGTISALGASGGNRAQIMNNSTAPGVVVSGTHQVVGSIAGGGVTQVNAGSDLTANNVVQSALTIGGTTSSHGSMTVDVSDASGEPLDRSSGLSLGSLSSGPFGLISAGASGLLPLEADGFGSGEFPANGPIGGAGSGSPVPEPSAAFLAAIAVIVIWRRRSGLALWGGRWAAS
jgi:autotransporter-associated beta strand protein